MMAPSPPLSPAASADAARALLRRVPVSYLGGMEVAAIGMQETVDLMIEAVRLHPRPGLPLYLTSTNGEVVSRRTRDPDFARLMASADLVNADGQPMVMVSRYVGERALPERVATTDLFPVIARSAVANGLTFYLFGATEEENLTAVEAVRRQHPGIRIVGHCHGFLSGDALDAKVAEIDALAPDILWVALGVPREQTFVRDYAHRLPNVAVIKTSGGLFNFLSGLRARAPRWLQRIGFEWIWRLAQEPMRLFWRYALTNPHAIGLLLTRSGARGRRRADRRPGGWTDGRGRRDALIEGRAEAG